MKSNSPPTNNVNNDIRILLLCLAGILIIIWALGEKTNTPPDGAPLKSNIIAKKSEVPKISKEETLAALFRALRFANNEVESQIIEARLYNVISSSDNAVTNAMMLEAYSLESSGKDQDALRIYINITKLDSQYSESYARAAAIAFRSGDKILAKNMIETALHLEPRNFATWFGLGTIYEDEGDYKKALHAYNQAIYFNPNFLAGQRAIFRIESQIEGLKL